MGKSETYSAQLFKVLINKCAGRGGFSFRNSGYHRLLDTPHLGILPKGKTLTERIGSSSIPFSKKETQFNIQFNILTAIFIAFQDAAETRVFLLSPHWKGNEKVGWRRDTNEQHSFACLTPHIYHRMYVCNIVYILQQCLWICKTNCGTCILSLLQLKK